jgi:hypothetical protein
MKVALNHHEVFLVPFVLSTACLKKSDGFADPLKLSSHITKSCKAFNDLQCEDTPIKTRPEHSAPHQVVTSRVDYRQGGCDCGSLIVFP